MNKLIAYLRFSATKCWTADTEQEEVTVKVDPC